MAGSENETRVLYKIIADFTELSKKARAARKDIADLKTEEAALNATSAKGSVDSEKAHTRDTKASTAQATAMEKVVGATKRATTATTEHAVATERSSAATTRAHRATGAHAGSLSATDKILNSATNTFSRLTGARDRDSVSTRRNAQETAGLGRVMGGALGQAKKFQKGLDKIGDWRPRLIPPFIALVPIIGSVIALINPLIAGLGAVGGAAIGLASNISSIAGAALGVVPALAALLSMVGAIKVAFGGIGKAFKANTAAKAAGAKGGSAAAPAKAEISTAEEIARAWEKYRRAIENVQYAQDDLDEARTGYTKRLNDLTKAVNRNAASEARAAANAQLSRENYANVLADPGSTKGEKMSAAVDVTDSKNAVIDASQQTRDDASELAKMQADGIEGDKAVVMAKRALVDAMWAERDAYIDTQNAGKDSAKAASAAATAADAFAAALDKLSPSAKAVVLALIGMTDAWNTVKKTVQESFFSEIVKDIERLRLLFPSLTSMLSDTAGAVGRVANKFLLMITSQGWLDDFYRLGKQNVPIIENLGDALLSMLNVFRDLTFAAGPFTIALTEGLERGAANMERMMSAARESGSLAAWLETVNTRMSQWWRIIKNIGMTLFNFGAAAGNFGQWITDAFEGITEGWKSASESARTAGSPFQAFLENIKPLLSEVGGLLGDFFQWFAKTSADPANIAMFTDFVKILRDDLGPILADVLDSMSKSGMGHDLAEAIVSILEALDTFLNNGGLEGMGTFWASVEGLFDAFNKIIELTPAPVISALTSSLGVLAALRFFGVNSMLGYLLSVLNHKNLGRLRKLLSAIGIGGGKAAPVATATASGAAGAAEGAAGGGIVASLKKFFTKGPGASVAGAAEKGGAGRFAGIVGKGALKGLGIASIATIAADLFAEYVVKDGKKGTRDTGGSVGSGALAGGALGAALGSVVPVVGTAVGAGAGAVIGGGLAAAGIDSEQWTKTAEELKTSWNDNVVPAWNTASSAVSTWWEENVVTPFGEAATNVSTWWDESVVAPFSTAAANVSAWWNENVVTPFNAVAGAFGATGDLIGRLWGEAATTVSTWWSGTVVPKWNEVADAVSTWWSGTVVTKWNEVADGISSWWSSTVVPKWNAVADGISSWWNSTVVPKWNAAITTIGSWWQVNVADKWSAAITTIGSWWQVNVADKFAKVATSIDKAFDAFRNFKIPDVSEGITKGANWFTEKINSIATGDGAGKNAALRAGSTLSRVNQILPAGARVTSTYRTPAQNAAVGGVTNSYHTDKANPAVDIAGSVSAMDQIHERLKAIGGWRELLYRVKGHFDHVHVANTGGQVPGAGTTDSVKSLLTPGEFVVRKAVTRNVGADNLKALNSGTISFAQMLANANKNSSKGEMPSPQFFNSGGLVSPVSRFAAGGQVTAPERSVVSPSGGFTVERLEINNPVPETAAESMPRAIRKLAYLGGR